MSTDKKPRGTCPVCGRGPFRLIRDGKVGRHGDPTPGVWPPRNCDGVGEEPARKGCDE